MDKNVVYYAEYESPIGVLLLAATSTGICSLEFGRLNEVESAWGEWAARYFGHVELVFDKPFLSQAALQLDEYFAGQRTAFDLPLDLRGTPFQLRVWHALTEIPYGQTRSYKQIAAQIGSPRAVRAVGGANNRNPISIIVPCHRVIGANGDLVGYGGGLSIKRQLLRLENEDMQSA